MDAVTFREQLKQQGYSGPELVSRDANLFNDEHSHEFSVSALILEGELTVTTASGATTCRAGETFTLESGIPHTEQYGPDGARLLLGRRSP